MIAAEYVARIAHEGQTDKSGRPMIEHVERVASQFQGDAQEAAWLHDVVEDTDVSLGEIQMRFSGTVSSAVDRLTRKSDESYALYIERLCRPGDTVYGRASRRIAIAVKVADVRDNLSDARRYEADESMRKRYWLTLERLVAAQGEVDRQTEGER